MPIFGSSPIHGFLTLDFIWKLFPFFGNESILLPRRRSGGRLIDMNCAAVARVVFGGEGGETPSLNLQTPDKLQLSSSNELLGFAVVSLQAKAAMRHRVRA
jgi:hypothetical protein